MDPDLPVPHAVSVAFQNHWQRFEESVSRSFAGDEQLDTRFLETLRARNELPMVWGCSDFIAQACIARPELAKDLLQSEALDRVFDGDALTEWIRERIGKCDNEAELMHRLRRIRQWVMVWLGWRDLAGISTLEETMQGVSILADETVRLALQHHQDWLSQRYGVPADADTGQASEMLVLGLGKLGGNELNYSSDIDLIFTYSEAGSTDGGASGKILDNQEYFTRLVRKIVGALDPVTEDGFVFRTDLRLRPNGDSGPPVLSFAAMEHYYQTHGRTWERYALIKARVVAGDAEQGEIFMRMIRPFVYRKYLDFGAFEAIREMKGMIQRELNRSGSDQNIKLGWGGIREIEFLAQSHQLIRGGRETRLQTGSLYAALAELADMGVLDKACHDALISAYRFLRNTEHRLQMEADRQTQLLPEDEKGQQRLAWSMGFPDWPDFLGVLDTHREDVHARFREILAMPETQDENPDKSGASPVRHNLEDIWQGNQPEDQATQTLVELGFGNAENTPKLLSGFRAGRLYQAFSSIERDRIDRLMPLALIEAARHPNSERAISSFVSILEAIGRRTAYLSLLIENPIALSQLLHLCAASPWLSRHIGLHPVILDELLNPIDDIRNTSAKGLQQELQHRLEQLDGNDEEARLNCLREFQQAQVLRVASADISGNLEVEEVQNLLTCLAEVLLAQVLEDATAHTENKLPRPDCEAGVIAYGKFASYELGYHSDLDVVVCFDIDTSVDPATRLAAEYFFSRMGRRFLHLLSTRTQAGQLYEIDMRLRPSGRSGTLVSSLTGFLDYQLNKAWTWEHQALVRARVVVGSERFRAQFERVRKTVLTLRRESGELARDITEMRRKMIDANCQSTETEFDIKLGEGGIVDIEFLVQYWILLSAADQPALLVPRDTEAAIAALVEHNIVDKSDGQNMLDSYRAYLRRSLDLKLMDQPVLVNQDELVSHRQAISEIWNATFG